VYRIESTPNGKKKGPQISSFMQIDRADDAIAIHNFDMRLRCGGGLLLIISAGSYVFCFGNLGGIAEMYYRVPSHIPSLCVMLKP
jgi:hypothetical protein